MTADGWFVTDDPQRLMWAGAAFVLFMVSCIWSMWPRRRPAGAAEYLVLFASQTGQAEEIARRTCAQLRGGGREVAVLSLADVTAGMLAAAKTLLVVASSTGDGDAPDDGLPFERGLMHQMPDLSGKRFAVLALGDRKYDRFCAFGHRLFEGFSARGAEAMEPCLEVDDLDAAVLERWDALLHRLGGADAAAENLFAPWRLTVRVRLNPDGAQPLYRLCLTPEGELPGWQAGDLAEIQTPDGHRRDYSVASLPGEGQVELFVRAVPDGIGSSLLTRTLAVGDTVPLRVKTHRNFHAPQAGGPVLMIAAGSGLAGLRAHIFQAQNPGWLIYGERHPGRDGALCAEARTWPVARLDLAFSQPDNGDGQYVQHVVHAQAEAIRAYLGDGGVILVCGGLTMGQGVDAALRAVMGNGWIERAVMENRYRRDLY